MRDTQMILENLKKLALNEDFVFERIYRNLYSENFLYDCADLAYSEEFFGKQDSPEDFLRGFGTESAAELLEQIRMEKYQPPRLWGEEGSAKKNKGERRPDLADKAVLKAIELLLEAMFEPSFSENSHGFREGHSVQTALKDVKDHFSDSTWIIDIYLEDFYKNIDASVLRAALKERVNDERFYNLINKYLKKGYLSDWEFEKTYSGTPVGNGLGQVLANIYLDRLDKFIQRKLAAEYNKGSIADVQTNPEFLKLVSQAKELSGRIEAEADGPARKDLIKELKKVKGAISATPRRQPFSEDFKRIDYVRYADRILIGVVGSKGDCEALLEKVRDFLEGELRLPLSNKTQITHLRKKTEFLGYDIRKEDKAVKVRPSQYMPKTITEKQITLKIPKGTINRIVAKKKMVKDMNKKPWIPMARREYQNLDDAEIVKRISDEIKRLHSYYSIADNVYTTFNSLGHIMEVSCLKTLSMKHKCSLKQMRKKLTIGPKQWGVTDKKRKGSKPVTFFKNYSQVYRVNKDPTLDLIRFRWKKDSEGFKERLLAGVCEVCGKETEALTIQLKDKRGKGYGTEVVCGNCRRK